jgi:hypothetical protein
MITLTLDPEDFMLALTALLMVTPREVSSLPPDERARLLELRRRMFQTGVSAGLVEGD